MTDEKLSEHFYLSEFTASQLAARMGIDNIPGSLELINLRVNAAGMELVRAELGFPILISSGLRVLALNRALKSPDGSAHVKGLATDFTCPGFGPPADVCRMLAGSAIQFDQLIFEHTWVHIAWPPIGQVARRDILTLLLAGGYATGILEPTNAPLSA